MRKRIYGALVFAGILGLSACHPARNPLDTDTAIHAAETLYRAEAFAMRHLPKPVILGHLYLDCLKDPTTISFTHDEHLCPHIFKGMLTFLHRDTHYRDITVSNLQDRKAFRRVSEWYLIIMLDNGNFKQVEKENEEGKNHVAF